MPYLVATFHHEAPLLLATDRSDNVFFDLREKTMTINGKGPIPVSMIGYQALYGLTLPTHITLTKEEITAARECIHATCRYPLISEISKELTPGSLMNK